VILLLYYIIIYTIILCTMYTDTAFSSDCVFYNKLHFKIIWSTTRVKLLSVFKTCFCCLRSTNFSSLILISSQYILFTLNQLFFYFHYVNLPNAHHNLIYIKYFHLNVLFINYYFILKSGFYLRHLISVIAGFVVMTRYNRYIIFHWYIIIKTTKNLDI